LSSSVWYNRMVERLLNDYDRIILCELMLLSSVGQPFTNGQQECRSRGRVIRIDPN